MPVVVEQEAKFRLDAVEECVRSIERLGARLSEPRHFEENVLYDDAEGRLSKRDEALRLRRAGTQSWLTWKGPQHGAGRIKRRRERESFVSDFDAVAGILDALGLAPSFRYEKYRAVYRYESAILTVDETPMGPFLEIEAEPATIEKLAGALGLDMSDAITLSYPRLYERFRLGNPDAPEHMTFDDPAR